MWMVLGTFMCAPILQVVTMRLLVYNLLFLSYLPFLLPQQLPCSSFQHIDENFLRANQAKLLSDPRSFYAVDMVNDCNMHYIDFERIGPPADKSYGKFTLHICVFISSYVHPAQLKLIKFRNQFGSHISETP